MTIDSNMSVGLVLALVSPILGMLLGVNLYFIRKLVEKIDIAATALPELIVQMKIMGQKYDELSREVSLLMDLKSRVARIEGFVDSLRASYDNHEGDGLN